MTHSVTTRRYSDRKLVLLNYRDTVLKKRLRIKTKFKYFRKGFLKYLNYTLLVFKYFRKSILLFLFKKIQSRSEDHTSELHSLMRISYSVFCLHNIHFFLSFLFFFFFSYSFL